MDNITKIIVAAVLMVAFGMIAIAFESWTRSGCIAAVAAHGWTPQQAKEACR